MRFKCTFTFVLFLMFFKLSYTQERIITELKTGWKFYKGHEPKAYQGMFDDSDWQDVAIPHDWAIQGPFIKNGDLFVTPVWVEIRKGIPKTRFFAVSWQRQ